MHYIYALCDPRDNQIRYIGITKNPNARLNQHIKDHRKHTHKNNWVNELLSCNLKPTITIVESIEDDSVCESREQFWIKYYRELGCDLTNITSGGRIGDGKKSEQGKANIIAALIKRNKSPEMRESSRKNGYRVVHTMHTPEVIEKRRIKQIGKKVHSDEFKRALAERNKTRKYDSEKMSDKALKMWSDPIKSIPLLKRISELGKSWRGVRGRNGTVSHEQAKMNSRKLWDDPVKGAEARAKLIERNKNRHHKASPT